MPAVPRLPFVPDLLNRVKIPGDLDSVTAIGDEAPDGGSIGPRASRGSGRRRCLYRCGVHPAMQVCVRREGEVVLDRAIGHARGNGPDDRRGHAQGRRHPGHAVHDVYSAVKGRDRDRRRTSWSSRALLRARRPGRASTSPATSGTARTSITIGHVLSHRAGVPNLPARGADLDTSTTASSWPRCCATRSRSSEPGKQLAYHAISGGFILGEVVHAGHGQGHPRRPGRGVPRPARLPLDQLRRRARGHRRRSRSTT